MTLDLPPLEPAALPGRLPPPRRCHSSTPDHDPLFLPSSRSSSLLQRESHPSLPLLSRPRFLAPYWPDAHHWRSASPPIHGNPPQICLLTSGSANGTGPRSLTLLWSLSLNNGHLRPAPGLTLRLCLPLLLLPAAFPHLNRAQSDSDSTLSLAKLVILVIGPSLKASVSASTTCSRVSRVPFCTANRSHRLFHCIQQHGSPTSDDPQR